MTKIHDKTIELSRKKQILKSNFKQVREKKAFIHYVWKLLLTSNKDVEQFYVVNFQIINASMQEESEGSFASSFKFCEAVWLSEFHRGWFWFLYWTKRLAIVDFVWTHQRFWTLSDAWGRLRSLKCQHINIVSEQ